MPAPSGIAVLVATVSAPMSEGARGLYNALAAWLTAHPGVAIKDVDTFRYESQYAADQQRIRIVYETGVVITSAWQARFYVSSLTTANTSAQEQFCADMQSGATFVPWFVIDVTKHKIGRVTADSIIVLGVNTASDPTGFNGKNIWIAEPQAAIAAGAMGSCKLFDGAGTLVGTFSVKNIGSSAWIQYQRNYAVVDEGIGQLVGLPTCDPGAAALVPPARTTTTAFPCPTYYPQTVPDTTPYVP